MISVFELTDKGEMVDISSCTFEVGNLYPFPRTHVWKQVIAKQKAGYRSGVGQWAGEVES